VTGRRRLAVLAVCAVVALLAAWYAGTRSPAPAGAPPAGSVRLGPDPGEPVADYLAGLPGQLPGSGGPTLALVQFATEQEASAALVAVTGSEPVIAVLRVAFPRVQTALRFEPLETGTPLPMALDNARQRAQQAAGGDAARLTGRAREIAAAEARALSVAGCRCVLALVVAADRAELQVVAARAGVRAVQAAPRGVTARELALSPLLPEQSVRADPPPDDGPVPPA
jgi:hypothetical protein